jgi:hypothetical protein
MEPVKLFARNNIPLSKMLLKINYDGACIIAAHQYLVATEGSGYLENDCKPDLIKRDYYTTLGKALIEYLTKN